MRQAVVCDNRLFNNICYIRELIPEQQSSQQNYHNGVFIPVFEMLHFLEFLCYKHIDTTLSQAPLDKLQVQVSHDQGCICHPFRDITWEILGICQQISGNLRAAMSSFQQSLSQYPQNRIQTATRDRIRDLHLPT